MIVLYIVLGFLLPVILVFVYSAWLHRQRQASRAAQLNSNPENKTCADLAQRCTALKNSVITDDAAKIAQELDSVLAIARSLKEQNLRELSLSQVMSVYVAIGQDKEARALLAEVQEEASRAGIIEKVFGNAP